MTATSSQINQLLLRARAHQQAGRRQQAERLWQQILAINPTHSEATQYLALQRMKQGALNEALPLLRTALQAKPGEGELAALCQRID